jgi:hypothetical protein
MLERQREGIAKAKSAGKRFGRPPTAWSQVSCSAGKWCCANRDRTAARDQQIEFVSMHRPNLIGGFFVGALSLAISDASAEPKLGRCHMGSCSWSMETNRQILHRERGRVLIAVEMLGGSSDHPADADYPNEYAPDIEIEWSTRSHTVHVLCDVQYPATIMGDQVIIIDFYQVSGVATSHANIWVEACYDASPFSWTSEDWLRQSYIPRLPEDRFSERNEQMILRFVSRYR